MHLAHNPDAPAAESIEFADFLRVDVRIGTVVAAENLEGARKPSLKLRIDFGPTIGEKKSCAQIATHYEPDALIGRQIAAVVNFPPRQVGKSISEVLTLGFADVEGGVILLRPDKPVPNGSRLF